MKQCSFCRAQRLVALSLSKSSYRCLEALREICQGVQVGLTFLLVAGTSMGIQGKTTDFTLSFKINANMKLNF